MREERAPQRQSRIDALLDGLERYAPRPAYPEEFAARVYKISRDPQGTRLTHLKLTGGSLRVKTLLRGETSSGEAWEEKADQLRVYSGEKFQAFDQLPAGAVCAVAGLTRTYPGQGLGAEPDARPPILEPVLNYRLLLPEGTDIHAALSKLRQLEEELRDVLDAFGGPVIWVSHDRGEVYRNCPRVCVLDRGRSAPAMDMKALMANPGTVSAARLSGCRNFVPVRPGPAPGLVEVLAWGLTLRTADPWRKEVTALGIRAGHVRPAEAGAVNAFPCQILRTVEDISQILAALRPEGAASGAPLLWMELSKDAWSALPDRSRILAAVRPEDLMLLE